MKIINYILRIIVGLVFILSGIAKLFPIEPFEIVFVDLGVANWLTAPFLARFIIAAELFLGLSILFNVWLKNKIYYTTQASLIIFTVYLIYLLITKGNTADCGCFGNFLPLSPIASILKNGVLFGLMVFINKKNTSREIGTKKWLPLLFVVIAFVSTFLLNRVGLHNIQGIAVNKPIDFSELPPLYKTNQKVDFSKGKKVVAFLSYQCEHCINATSKLVLLDREQKINNLYLVIGSKKEKGLLEFLEKTKPNFPFIWMNDDTFFKYSGGRLPAIIYMEDGVMKKKWYGELFDVDDIGDYFIHE